MNDRGGVGRLHRKLVLARYSQSVIEERIRMSLVRHGQSESNLAQRWQGQGDSPLSELGRQQAALLGERLRGQQFTRVIASDLSRAVETARATGHTFEQDPIFREFDVGQWEGLTREQVTERFPVEMEQLKRGEDIPLGGGESYSTFSRRIDGALASLLSQLRPGDHVLLVCHGGVIATVLAGVLGLRDAGRWSLARVANTSITELSFAPSGDLLHVFNDTLHLLPLGNWPPHADVQGVVGLVCDAIDGCAIGEYAAHYDLADQLAVLGSDALAEALASLLSDRVAELHALHPQHRVSLAAHGLSIHAWAEDALWRGLLRQGALAAPRTGSVSHVARVGERLVLLDYCIGRG